MKLQKLLFTAILLIAVSFQCMSDNHARSLYMFGFSASFNDSTVYFTDVQRVDSTWLDSKTKFLYSRDNYSYQLRDYLQAQQGASHPTAMVIFGEKRADVEKKYIKMRKRYISTKKNQQPFNIKYLTSSDFVFKGILPDLSYQQEQNKELTKEEKKALKEKAKAEKAEKAAKEAQKKAKMKKANKRK